MTERPQKITFGEMRECLPPQLLAPPLMGHGSGSLTQVNVKMS
jgi:hypothetical protein